MEYIFGPPSLRTGCEVWIVDQEGEVEQLILFELPKNLLRQCIYNEKQEIENFICWERLMRFHIKTQFPEDKNKSYFIVWYPRTDMERVEELYQGAMTKTKFIRLLAASGAAGWKGVEGNPASFFCKFLDWAKKKFRRQVWAL